ncbi:MAG: bifunctional tetrahydrofolate synthase/dihydrofolate synthase [Gammaproteobacteria bacterium]|nr:MAG: bifunctional tetrahydrofolate synthase/dihydrofolate synthase [Gammaproteobacteria bacterium]
MRTLEAWLALLERRHPRTIDLGLERCGTVYRQLGSPRPAKQVITVAGTNGKGSTVAYLAAMSGGLGQRYGSYTSPHIVHFNERISIMGEPVSEQRLVGAFEQVEAVRDGVSLTYFEFTTLAALLILQQSELDCAVLEVGLGGRLDTVNLVDTDCAVITPIGLDHQGFLGKDLTSIAHEKAGILRAGIPVVCAETQPPEPILQAAADLQAPLYRRLIEFDLAYGNGEQLKFSLGEQAFAVRPPPMGGRHQLDNLAAALAAIVLLNPNCADKPDAVTAAICNCKLPGRLQQVASSPAIILDVGHNELAANAVAAYFGDEHQAEVICVLAMLADKPAEAVALALGQVCSRWLCADTGGERGQTGELLARRVKDTLPAVQVGSVGSLDAAMDEALSLAAEVDTILVFGSFSGVSDALAWCRQHGRHDAAKIP